MVHEEGEVVSVPAVDIVRLEIWEMACDVVAVLAVDHHDMAQLVL